VHPDNASDNVGVQECHDSPITLANMSGIYENIPYHIPVRNRQLLEKMNQNH